MFKNIFSEIDRILFRDRRPWIEINLCDNLFLESIKEIKHIELPFTLAFNLSIEQPFNNKTRYYHQLILQSKNQIILQLANSFYNHEVPVLQLEKSFKEVEMELNSRIRKTSKIINALQFGSGVFDWSNLALKKDLVIATNAYIVSYLRLSFFQILFEIQTRFSDLLNQLLFTEGFLSDRKSEITCAQDCQPVTIARSQVAIPLEPPYKEESVVLCEKGDFVAVYDNLRKRIEGIGLFRDMIKNPSRFGRFEEQLYLRGIINLDCSFCGKRGSKNLLAVIYHYLIEKNYFKGFDDTLKRRIKHRDIVRFLNHRYEIDLFKQYDMYKNDPDERARYIDSIKWLKDLPSC